MKKVSYSSASIVRWFIAELVGTALLAITVAAGLTYDSIFVPVYAGLMVAVLVYTIGSVSGAHMNPAVSLAMAVFRSISWPQFLVHIIAQIAGAFLGFTLSNVMLGGMPSAPVGDTTPLLVAEFVSALILVFTITHVVMGRISAAISGLAIGLSFMLAGVIGSAAGAGVFNPALALALRSESVNFLFVPFLGALAGAALASLLHPHSTKA